MTRLEIFKKGLEGLALQGEKAFLIETTNFGDKHQCKYRLTKDDGSVCKCFAGHLIPDELYSEKFEGKMFYNIEIGIGEMLEDRLDVDGYFVVMCQTAHDNSEVSAWKSQEAFKKYWKSVIDMWFASDKLSYVADKKKDFLAVIDNLKFGGNLANAYLNR